MATFEYIGATVFEPIMDARFFLFQPTGGISSSTTTRITGTNFFGQPLTYFGSFTLNDDGDVTGGTISRIIAPNRFEIRDFSIPYGNFFELAGVLLGAGEDTFIGDNTANWIAGENVSDPNRAERFGNDTLFGFGGNDLLHGGPGDDVLDGGDGYDIVMTYFQTAGRTGNVSSETISWSSIIPQLEASSGLNLTGRFSMLLERSSVEAGVLYDSFGSRDLLIDMEEIAGTQFDDVIVAAGLTPENIGAFAGQGVAYGLGGNDVLFAVEGTGFISGGAGDDLIIGSIGNDLANGDDGDDLMFGRAGTDRYWGGAGSDYLDGGDDFDWFNTFNQTEGVRTNLSNLNIDLNALLSRVNYAEVSLLIPFDPGAMLAERSFFDANANYESAGTRDLLVNFEGVRGTPFGDLIFASGDSEYEFDGLGPGGVAYGEFGNDVVIATSGTAFISGGEGADLLIVDGVEGETISANGDGGNDILLGGVGDDVLRGNSGDDLVFGGAGNDFLEGDDPIDKSASGDDTIYGGDGEDTIIVGPGDDAVFGGKDADEIWISRSEGENQGNNQIFGGASESDATDLLSGDTVKYDVGRAQFKVVPTTSPSAGFGFEVTYTQDSSTDTLVFIDEICWSDGVCLNQATLAAMPAISFALFALNDAFGWLRENGPNVDPPEPFARVIGWLTAAEEVVDLLADVASTTDREAAIKRAFVLGGEKVFDASVDQARDLLDDLVLSRLPEDLKNQANQKIDEAIGNLKPKVLDAAEVVGELYADGSQQIGGWIGNSLFELYDQWQVLFEDEYQKNLPNQSPLQDVQQGFDIEQIIIDSKYIPEPLLTPRPQQPDLVEPEEGPQIIQLNLSLDTTIKGTLEELDGDVVYDFFLGDRIILENVTLSPDSVTVRYSSAILEIDADLDGFTESTITLEGDFDSIEFSIEQVGPDTVIRPFSVNGSPSAIDDTILVSEDQSVSGNVLEDNGNGIDRDPDGDDLTVSLVSGPSEGSLILNDDGSFTYEADADVFDLAAPGEVIDQTFTYQIDDGNGETDQATVTIFVAIQDDGQTIVGMNKKDTLNGTDGGEDIIYGNNAKDMIYGLDGADTIYGGNADDMLFGGESADSLFGERGDDQLFGEQGEDYLDGGRGSDVLRGGFDDDTLLGGRGDDVFVLGLGEGTDTILDYGVGEDFIGLVGLTFDDLTFGQSGDNATISSGGEVLATLIGVNSLTLDETDVFNFI